MKRPGNDSGNAESMQDGSARVTPVQRTSAHGLGWVRWLLLLTVAGYLLFAHGCHSDKDTELFIHSTPYASR